MANRRSQLDRREFLGVSAGLVGSVTWGWRNSRVSAQENWDGGSIRHLLPTVDHRSILLKCSLREPVDRLPQLRVGGRTVDGLAQDSRGLFWAFHVDGLPAGKTHRLELRAGDLGLCEPWDLRTFPPRDSSPDRFRLLVYTCAGGHEGLEWADGSLMYLSVENRRRLLERGMEFRPDAVVAIGDHVYWDQMTGVYQTRYRSIAELAFDLAGEFDRSRPVLGTDNEDVLRRAVAPQIADLYCTLLRSTPVFMPQDDHDYFENDVANDRLVTFPPDPFMLRLARATQHLFYPEFLPDDGRPLGLGGSGARDRLPGLSETYGTLRYGRLVEMLLYDCRRFLSLKGARGEVIERQAELWVTSRLSVGEAAHVVQVPSAVVGWSAGKWGEWYPDLLDDEGRLSTTRPKPFWQDGWLQQHDRLLAAASQTQGIPLFLNGDLHSLGVGHIHRSRSADLGDNPVHTLLTGPVGTGSRGWPSDARGTPGLPPGPLEVDEELSCLEQNGFTVIDFHRNRIEAQLFAWNRQDGPDEIPSLQPVHRTVLEPRS